MDVIEAIKSKQLFQDYFGELDSWANWLIVYKALFGMKLTEPELEIYRQCTGAVEQSFKKVKELWICAGRRSGKSRSAAFLSVWLALFCEWSKNISRGERPYIFIISPNRDQGQIIMNYVRELLDLNAMLRKQVKREFKESIELRNGITIAIKTASWRSTRGFSALACVLEECNFFRYELESAIRDKEIYRAVMPMLSTFKDSLCISISSPASPQGLMYEKFQKSWAKPGRVLCWRSPTILLNPKFDKDEIEQAYIDDPEAARSEYGAEWRTGVSSLFDPEKIRAVVDEGISVRPYVQDVEYRAFLDMSAGKSDSSCLGIAHYDSEENQVVLDVLLEREPPFRPRDVAQEFSATMENYGITSALADAFGGLWITDAFEEFGIRVEPAKMSKSDYYLNFLPIVNNGSCRLLDQERLINQLINLERRTRGGTTRDAVDVFAGHDDCSNVTSAACVLCTQDKDSRPLEILWV